MDPATMNQLITSLTQTEVTKTVHNDIYPALSPSRPELSQAGRVVLITGGGGGVGRLIARSFVQAHADTVIIVGRSLKTLETCIEQLKKDAQAANSKTKFIAHSCDITDLAAVAALWKDLADQSITVDVFVANAAKFTDPKPILELGADEVWSQVQVNAMSPLYFTEKFYAQPSEKKKFIVHVTSQAAHMTAHPAVAERPAYSLSKMTGTMLFQLIAQGTPVEKMQIVSYHPGLVYGSGWEVMKFPRDLFDNEDLGGAFAVWAASDEAAFLHGRVAWASWDVDELASGEIRKRIDSDPEYLRGTVVGANSKP